MCRIFVLLLFVFVFSATSIYAEGTAKSLTIMLDGARADVMLMAKTPNFDAICDGSWAKGYFGSWSLAAHTIKDAPTISGPNHAAIATGVTTAKTQVPNNDLYKNYNNKNASATYKNCLTRIKEKYPATKTAFVFSWKPDKILVSKNNPCDLVVCESDQKNSKNVPKILDGSYENEHWKKGTDIDVMLYFIDLPDHVGHSGGYCPPGLRHGEYVACIEEIDGWLGEILDAIRKRPNFAKEDWQIIVTSDHGGWVNGHGAMRSENYTIPLMISGKNVVQGEMKGQPCNADVAVTILDHFGFDVAKMKSEGLLDGSVRGKGAAAGGAAVSVSGLGKTLEDGLIVYLPFDGNLENNVTKSAGATSEVIKVENRGAAIKLDGGKKNGYLEIRQNEQPQFITLGNPKALQFGADGNFSVAFWVRVPNVQKGEPVFIGNKDWLSGQNSGFCLFANPLTASNGNVIGLNIADNTKIRVDVKQIFVALNEWQFCAATVDRKNNATLFSGTSDGRLFFCSESLVDENLGKSFGGLRGSIDTPLSWNVGQDGTGKSKTQLNADIDELRIWNRALNLKEVESLFKNKE
ncbi:MAG: alkaline phosphatase family protein [Planctomycetaceae bacterium]|jgi:hypothetical protein|nr:alkaline phosphatase family protein [Planctomycetaceae bacterium]